MSCSSLTLHSIHLPDANKNDAADVQMDSQVDQGKPTILFQSAGGKCLFCEWMYIICNYTVGSESIQTPSGLCTLCRVTSCLNWLFFGRQFTVFLVVFESLQIYFKKSKIPHLDEYSVPLFRTLRSTYSIKTSWVVSATFAHLHLGSFTRSSWQILSSSFRSDGELRWAGISLHRFTEVSALAELTQTF